MKKEALFAIIVGIIVGLGITYAIYHFRQMLVPANNSADSTLVAPTATATPVPNDKLIITSPDDEAVLAETSATISGSADPSQMIVIFVNDEEYITQADDIGAFAEEVTLDSGSNVIKVTAIAADGTQTSKEIVVVVSTASLDQVEESADTASPSASATPSTNQ